MAAQEVVERLRTDPADEGDGESESVSLVVQLTRLVSLLAKAFPRLALRKLPSQTLAPLAELEQLVSPATKHATVVESRSLVRTTALLVQELGVWAHGKAGDNLTELTTSYALLISLLDATLEACADLIQSNIAQRVFEACFPRLNYRSVIRGDWEDGQEVVLLSLDASSRLGCGFDRLHSNPTLASLVLIAHALPPKHPTLPLLVTIFPVILTSLQSNVALDATLATLLKVLCASPPPQAELSPDIIIPLTTVLPLLCSAHPDALTRHITFRILGRVLQLATPVLRLQVLRDLVSTTEDASPHMRNAAIGLVKEAVLEALVSRRTENVFSTPLLLQTIGPHVFRLDPPDILASITEVDSLKDSPEPARLVECLGLYYVLLSRDVDNRTGIRDPGTIRSVESSLLGPIRSALGRWMEDSVESLPLAALQISMERVDDALKAIG
ncbi:hypothetical protein BJV78DRAFT_1197588 [Lactifluus subvellereus]|nr:hypothetical protein BJV78DRAFT_1197588 [Lactifluus subvellereus]